MTAKIGYRLFASFETGFRMQNLTKLLLSNLLN